jgi:hypothetical protein
VILLTSVFYCNVMLISDFFNVTHIMLNFLGDVQCSVRRLQKLPEKRGNVLEGLNHMRSGLTRTKEYVYKIYRLVT